MKHIRIAVAVAAALAIGIGVFAIRAPDKPEAVTFASRAPSPLSAGNDVAVPAAPPAEAAPPKSRTPIMDKASPQSMYDRLVASGKPVEAKLAYDLVQRCMNQNWAVNRVPPEYAESVRETARTDCGDLAPGVLTNEQQLALAKRAAEAGVHGAWLALWSNQVLRNHTLPPGPETEAEVERLRQIALSTADPTALVSEAEKVATLGDERSAFGLFVAYRKAQARDRGVPYDPVTDPPTQAKAAALPKDVAKSEIAKGTEYVAKAYRSQR